MNRPTGSFEFPTSMFNFFAGAAAERDAGGGLLRYMHLNGPTSAHGWQYLEALLLDQR